MGNQTRRPVFEQDGVKWRVISVPRYGPENDNWTVFVEPVSDNVEVTPPTTEFPEIQEDDQSG